jgi:integrase
MAAKIEKSRTPGIYRRGSRYVFSYRDATGKQRWESCATERLAKAAKAKRATQAAEGIRPESKITLHAYAHEWISAYTGRTTRGFRENTRSEYRRQLEQYPLRYWNDRKLLKDIRAADVRKFVAWLCDEQEQHQALADETIKRIMAPFKAMLSTAYEDEIIIRNPAVKVILPNRDAGKVREDDDAPAKAMTEAELERFFDHVDAKWRTFFWLLAATGIRVSEAVGLQWQHVQLTGSRPHIRIRRAIVKGAVGAPKSRHGRRDVPIPHDLAVKLVEARSNSEWYRDEDPVFATLTGKPLSDANIRHRVLAPTADAADIPWIGFHSFRHTAASTLLTQGRDIVQVSRWLGHGEAGFTLRVYAHLMGEGVGGPLDVPGANQSANKSPHHHAAHQQPEDHATQAIPDPTTPSGTTGDHF